MGMGACLSAVESQVTAQAAIFGLTQGVWPDDHANRAPGPASRRRHRPEIQDHQELAEKTQPRQIDFHYPVPIAQFTVTVTQYN